MCVCVCVCVRDDPAAEALMDMDVLLFLSRTKAQL